MDRGPWTVDADDIHVAEDFDDTLLHRTPEVESFRSPDRDDKFIVIGTKGFGKTLFLKAKRILASRTDVPPCLRTGSLLDRPVGDRIFGREGLAFFATSPLPWSKLGTVHGRAKSRWISSDRSLQAPRKQSGIHH